MANPFLQGRDQAGVGGNPFVRQKKRGSGKRNDDERIQILEALQRTTGARQIEEESPGLFRKVVDIISRPNYAVAGAAEELFTQRGQETPEGPIGRAFRELFSGIGGLKGEKEDFGQVLEQSGIGTYTLADAIPALDGTFLGELGSRGALGLALDIVADPLTYITLGSTTGIRVGLKSGTKTLSKKGLGVFNDIRKVFQPQFDEAMKIADDAVRIEEVAKVRSAMMDTLESRIVDTSGKVIDKSLLDPGGLKFAGAEVVDADTLSKLGSSLVSTMEMFPGGGLAIRSTKAFADGTRAMVNGLFHPFAKTAGLPPGMRAVAERLERDFVSKSGIARQRLFSQWAELERDWKRLSKADPNLGKKFYGVREGWGGYTLTAEQKELFDRTVKIYDSMSETAVRLGVLDPAQVKPGYFHHSYTNAEDLSMYHIRPGFAGPQAASMAKFTRERAFDTYDDAVKISSEMNRMGREGGGLVYPVLEPNYDVMQNLASYIHQHSDAVARKAWVEEVVRTFGKEVDEFTINAMMDLATPIKLELKDKKLLDSFISGSKTLRQFEKEAITASRITIEQSDLIRRALLRLDADTPPAGRASRKGMNRGFTERNFERGSFLAEKLRRGVELGPREILDARKIVSEQRSQVYSALNLWNKELKDKFNLTMRFTRESIGRTEAQEKFAKEVSRLAKQLSDDGKRELFRDLFTRVNSPSQAARMHLAFRDEFGKFFPSPKAIREGEIAREMPHWGEKALYRPKSGGLWGDTVKMIPEAVIDQVENFNSKIFRMRDYAGVRDIINGFDWFNNMFKTAVYSFWPASLVRDMYSNVGLSFLDISVGAIARPLDTAKVMRGTGDVVLNGKTWKATDLSKLAGDYGVVDKSGRSFAELTGKGQFKATGWQQKVLSKRAVPENYTRVQLWLNNINRGMDPRDAADKVREFLFAYNELSPFEREFMRRMIPFYTFPRKAIELHAKMLVRRPGRIATELKPFRGREDENSSMVKWKAEALKIRLDKDGKTVTMLNGIDLPIRTLDTLWTGTARGTGRRIMGMVTPILKVPLETITGRDFFTGGDVKRAYAPTMGRIVESLNTPKAIKDWLGYDKRIDAAGRPTYTVDGARYSLLVRSWVLSRVFTTTDRQFREYSDDPGIARNLLDFLTGLRAEEVDMNEQNQQLVRRRIRQLEEVLVRRGVLKEGTYTFGEKP